jgi:drug/metabolite transporter (DMT)-like permease
MAGRQDSEVAVTDKVVAAVNALPVENRRLGLILVVLAALAWSSGGLLLRSVDTDPWTTIFWRSLFAAITLILFILIRDGRASPRLFLTMGWPGLLMAGCFATASTSFVVAVQWTTVANVLFLQGLAPFFAAIFGLIFMRERVEPRTWIAMAFAVGGVGIMVSDSLGSGSIVGDLFGILIAVSFGGATVILRFNRNVRMTPAACLATLLAGTLALLQGASPGSASLPDLGCLALLGAGQLALGMILYTSGARLIPAAESALLTYIEIVFGALWVWLVFAENPGARALIGGLVILGCLIGHTLVDLRRGGGKRVAPPAT